MKSLIVYLLSWNKKIWHMVIFYVTIYTLDLTLMVAILVILLEISIIITERCFDQCKTHWNIYVDCKGIYFERI